MDENTIVEKSKKEQFEDVLETVKNMNEAIKLHNDVKNAVEKEEVDYNYLRYVENCLQDKLFGNFKVEGIMPKVLLEVICTDLVDIPEFDEKNLIIQDIGSHFEEQENYLDKICIYNNKIVNVFGISEMHPDKVLKYEVRKFLRADMIKAVQAHYKEGQKIKLYQYDEYYVGIEEDDRIKVFSQRKMTSLVKVEETIFDKIKTKFSNLFVKKKSYLNLELVYDNNQDRLSEFEYNTSKIDAKKRMKFLLSREREITRVEN